jgi:cytochrome c553
VLRIVAVAPAFVSGVLVVSPVLAQDAAAPAGDPAAGRKIAAGICQSCHGMNGIAQMPDMPTIAGGDATYLLRQLEAYRSGERKNEMMSAVAPMLDDRKMADVAAYYASMQVTSAPP